ncbi:response regulator [Anoxynatronum sibiricum]|uniref:Stage 0 sporulation protein A homolog n=1 Tax=Anoxynatronum sibiricum TaxID=210623 RepID=A0ABU9VTL9_9CLOT
MSQNTSLSQRIVIVDDSPFSVSVLENVLTDLGHNVVGSADSLEQTIEVVGMHQPDLVTMDMTIPGTDGLECTKAIKKRHPGTKVVIISSLKDEAMMKKAKEAGAVGYVQKPVDSEELGQVIDRLVNEEQLLEKLNELGKLAFQESLMNNMNRIFGEKPVFQEPEETLSESQGISVVMGIIGAFSGRFVMDLSYASAEAVVKKMLKRETVPKDEVLNSAAELANMVAGNACSMINQINKLYALRLAPPTIYHGESLKLSTANLAGTTIFANTSVGDMHLNFGFAKGEHMWM